MPPTVRLLLKGSLVLFAKETQSNGSVRVLREPPPNHRLSLSFAKRPPGGTLGPPIPVDFIQNNLNLQIQNPIVPNITLEDKAATIDRKSSPRHTQSANWFVDLENPNELYKNPPIGVKPGGFKHVLTFNSGNLFTDALGKSDNPSYNPLQVQRGENANYENFGFVAIRIGIDFNTNDSVRFTNGTGGGAGVIFDSTQDQPGTTYEINLVNDLDPAIPHPRICTDANHYYKGVGPNLTPAEKILFASVTENEDFKAMITTTLLRGDRQRATLLEQLQLSGPAGPEAACFPAYMSKTDP